MAEYQAPMAEKLRKSVGNVTYYIMHGKTFARAKVAHVKNAKTPKQLRPRKATGIGRQTALFLRSLGNVLRRRQDAHVPTRNTVELVAEQ